MVPVWFPVTVSVLHILRTSDLVLYLLFDFNVAVSAIQLVFMFFN